MTNDADLPARIRSEANIADRPGQLDRLNGIADEVEALTADLDAANADAAAQFAGRKRAERYVGSLPMVVRAAFDAEMDRLDRAHRARIGDN